MTKFVSNFNDDDEVSDEIFLARMRHWRDQQLLNSDWTQLADAPVDKVAWAEYRQALRDMPQQNADLRKIEIPERP